MKQQSDVMLDLETFGSGPRSVIVAIGAVFFDPYGGTLGDEFYRRIDPESCAQAGLVIDPATVVWWLQQSDAARSEVIADGDPLREVLDEFAWFIGAKGLGGVNQRVRVWGNGAAFDNVILGSAYRAFRKPSPWAFWNDRCYRTMKELNRHVPLEREGTHHNALHDARSQARHLVRILSGRALDFTPIPRTPVSAWRRLIERALNPRRKVKA